MKLRAWLAGMLRSLASVLEGPTPALRPRPLPAAPSCPDTATNLQIAKRAAANITLERALRRYSPRRDWQA